MSRDGAGRRAAAPLVRLPGRRATARPHLRFRSRCCSIAQDGLKSRQTGIQNCESWFLGSSPNSHAASWRRVCRAYAEIVSSWNDPGLEFEIQECLRGRKNRWVAVYEGCVL